MFRGEISSTAGDWPADPDSKIVAAGGGAPSASCPAVRGQRVAEAFALRGDEIADLAAKVMGEVRGVGGCDDRTVGMLGEPPRGEEH